jgi:UDP-N-acetyl-D-galactosamine dehydrogenase
LEQYSGLKCPQDFTIGYSPERINPGDKEHTVDKIAKVVAGYDTKTLDILAEMYGSITTGVIHKASCIKVAEASKIIENTQRDINIAIINEIAKICDKL